jgi:anti-sigma B factor antagonist
MILNLETEGNIAVLSMNGRLDTMHFPLVDKELVSMIENERKQIVLDCQNLDYISSSGLRVLLKALKQMEAAKGRLTICSLQPQISQIFKISGFDRLFEIYPGKKEAIASFL